MWVFFEGARWDVSFFGLFLVSSFPSIASMTLSGFPVTTRALVWEVFCAVKANL